MAALLQTVQSDLDSARRARDKDGVLLLGTILSDLKNREIELGRAMVDDEAIEVVRRGIKRRRESHEMYVAGGRPELAAREAAEVSMLERYLPAAPSADEIRAAVQAAVAGGAVTVGAAMAAVMPQFKGRVEGGTINAIVREELARRG
jgi:uncharacterized protein